MSETVDRFFASRENSIVTKHYMKFKQKYISNKKQVHIFVENTDDFEFYRKSIEFLYNSFIIYHYPMEGKNAVLTIFRDLDWTRYNKSKVLFFVDKDYDCILGISNKISRNIFVTKYYSIENYLCSNDVFKYILKNIYKIKHESLIDEVLSDFIRCYVEFEKLMKYLTAIILIFRIKENHLKLEYLKPSDFFFIKKMKPHLIKYRTESIYNQIVKSDVDSIVKKAVKKNKNKEAFIEAEADVSLITFKEIRQNIKKLDIIEDSRVYIRGKYHLWFLIEFLKDLNTNAQKINTKIKQLNEETGEKYTDINQSIQINESNIFDILPMKIDKHNDVNIFLINNIQKI